ncbi:MULTISPECIES: MBL fold metallo-hydrolase [Halorussus]|uniref:MBL fold metallo-hydrolase n=1 Tax=Halorussus TaxID=1070314 RepID=UPI0020A225EF|nr:MBL fold metallo-hydrolase [Halorussus vallis]USZ77255.1 MBL fold metallo-hydrolase [Halorussus vallis]
MATKTTATEATELGEGVWWFDLGGVNSYLVEDGDDLVLVDAGTPRDADAIAAGVRETGHAVQDVARVLVTHYDLDHVGALSRLDLSAPVYVGRPDAYVLAGRTRPNWRNHKGLLQRVSQSFVSPPDLPIRPVSDGDEVGGFTAYHTPGHSPGHLAWVAEDPSAAFLGDLVREKDGRLEASPWVMSYDPAEVKRSVRRLADGVPDFEVAAMGHGTPIMRNGSARLRELASRV